MRMTTAELTRVCCLRIGLQLGAFVKSEIAKRGRMVKTTGAKVD